VLDGGDGGALRGLHDEHLGGRQGTGAGGAGRAVGRSKGVSPQRPGLFAKNGAHRTRLARPPRPPPLRKPAARPKSWLRPAHARGRTLLSRSTHAAVRRIFTEAGNMLPPAASPGMRRCGGSGAGAERGQQQQLKRRLRRQEQAAAWAAPRACLPADKQKQHASGGPGARPNRPRPPWRPRPRPSSAPPGALTARRCRRSGPCRRARRGTRPPPGDTAGRPRPFDLGGEGPRGGRTRGRGAEAGGWEGGVSRSKHSSRLPPRLRGAHGLYR
jgi:hypothetical protein